MRTALQLLLIEDSEADKTLFEFSVLHQLSSESYAVDLVWHKSVKAAIDFMQRQRIESGVVPDFIFIDPTGTGVLTDAGSALQQLTLFVPRDRIVAVTGHERDSKIFQQMQKLVGRNSVFTKHEESALVDTLKDLSAQRTSSGGIHKDVIRLESRVSILEERDRRQEQELEATKDSLLQLRQIVLQGGTDGSQSIAQLAYEARGVKTELTLHKESREARDVAQDKKIELLEGEIQKLKDNRDTQLQIRLKRMDLMSAMGKWPLLVGFAIAALVVANFLGLDAAQLIELVKSIVG